MNMTNAFYRIILKFGQEVGMEGIFTQTIELLHINIQSIGILSAVIMVIALLSCFFGFKLFRLCSAVMAFFLTAIGICEMLRPTAHMGVIVTTFAIVGLVVAFLAYQWYKISVFFVCAILGFSLAALFTGNIWICVAAAILFGTISVPFAFIAVTLSTAVWGAVTLGFLGLPYLGINLTVYKVLATVGFAAAGLLMQYLMNRNMGLFPEKGLGISRNAVKN
ncbi:TMEM198/TM7SF3 family protein [Candidatus Micrarchaeota archaeon]|nr:TMEM198/TM7SF3 family protein [Candidatus Micrarchaeota archaeon]